jgi:carboxylate-amine ligase
MSLAAVRDWTYWSARAVRPWSVRLSEDVMVVEPDRRALACLADDALDSMGRLLTAHAELTGAVVTLTTTPRESVAEAAAEATLLRSELADALAARADLTAFAAGLHPWSETGDGRLDPVCGFRVDVAVPDADGAVRALDALRLHVPLLIALSANSPFWRGRDTGLASARTALRAAGRHPELTRSFGTYTAYVAAIDALLAARAIRSADSVPWDARVRPDLGAVEVTVMDSQTRPSQLAPLAALVQCLVRLHAEGNRADRDVLPELVLHNRAVAARMGARAELIDPAGHFARRVIDELELTVDACAPAARELGCARELASVLQCATDPGDACQRSIEARFGMTGLLSEMVEAFSWTPTAARTSH